jgi:succinate dehydrogenase flavin-adding protein (antitoxin of CptAB toxin-antitoxin module)
MNANQDKLKRLKYRCQTLGIKELDVIFQQIFEVIKMSDDEKLINLLDELLKHETQYIFDLFFNSVSGDETIKYKPITNLIK